MKWFSKALRLTLCATLVLAAPARAQAGITVTQPEFLPGDFDTFKILIGLSQPASFLAELIEQENGVPKQNEVPRIDALTSQVFTSSTYVLKAQQLDAGYPLEDASGAILNPKSFLSSELVGPALVNGTLLHLTFDEIGVHNKPLVFDWLVRKPGDGQPTPSEFKIKVNLDFLRNTQEGEATSQFSLYAVPALIPEPESFLLVAAGLGMVAFARARRARL